MKKQGTIFIIILLLVFSLVACTSTENAVQEPKESPDPAILARENVVQKWENSANDPGTPKYIEDIYKQYPDDEVIANIYFYCISKQQYDYYLSLDNEDYLDDAIEYAEKIDPEYNGTFSQEIQEYADKLLINEEDRADMYSQAAQSTDRYNSLTNSDKKEICEFIQSRYDYYDSLAGGYTGDKYTDTIWQETMDKYGLTESQVDIIWMNMYSY